MQHLLAGFWYIESVGVLPTVPHQDLRVGRDWLDRVEVDVEVYLAGYQILLRRVVTEVHVVHPVALARVAYVEVLVDVVVLENLQKKGQKYFSLELFLLDL